MASEKTEAARPEDANAVPGRLPRTSLDPVYEFNAPQFHDFTNARDDPIAAESYFEDGRRKTICKPRLNIGELAPVSETEALSEEGLTKATKATEAASKTEPTSLKACPNENKAVAPESPGLRIPTHSVLDTERLAMASASSRPGKDVPGFMRSRKSGVTKDNLKQQQDGAVNPKSKKSVKVVTPPDLKFGLEGPRHPAPKSSEEIELEKIRKDMQAAAALREKNKARMLEASKSEPNISVPRRATKNSDARKPAPSSHGSSRGEPTKNPKHAQFNAASSGGTRGRSRTRSDKAQPEILGFAGPRSRSRSLSISHLENQPPNSNPGSAPFTPLTIQTSSFFAKRSESKGREQTVPTRTLPQEFHLSTPRRANRILSSEEKELLEIKQHAQFKARKMPKKILQSTGDVGVPRIHKKTATVAEGFSFATSKRSSHSRPSSVAGSEKEGSHQFKARPVPQSVLKPTPRRPQTAPVRSTTIPKSPRISKPKPRPVSPVKNEEVVSVFHARPMPDFSRTPHIPSVSVRAPTQPDPFPLKTEQRGKIKQQQFKELLSAEEKVAEEQRIYKARPLVFPSPMKIQHGPVHITEPKPFTLKSEEIGQKIKESFQTKLDKEREKENERFSSFKARVPLHKVKEPFVPAPVPHDPILPEPFHLISEERAVKRATFDRQVEQQHREAEAARGARRLEKEQAELEGLMASLDAVAFKARPFKMRSGFQVAKSTVPLTTPLSPEFASDKRLKKASAVKAA